MMKLRSRPRVDTLVTETRKRKRSIAPYVYLGLLTIFLGWIVDLFMGDMLYLRADGIVLQNKVVVASEFLGTVTNLDVDAGSRVVKGQPIAHLRSQDVEERLARLSADYTSALALSGQAKVQAAFVDATQSTSVALQQMSDNYAGGVIRAPVDGIVGDRLASVGSVVPPGQTLLNLFIGTPYVLAYVPDGVIYELRAGDPIRVHMGLDHYSAHVEDVMPLYSKLPEEFVNTFQAVKRGRVVKVAFEPGQTLPPLFSNTTISSQGMIPPWLKRKFTTLL